MIAVHPRRHDPATRAGHRPLGRPGAQSDQLALVHHILDDQRRQTRKHQLNQTIRSTHATSCRHTPGGLAGFRREASPGTTLRHHRK
ncbi:hypothetical protein Franean1_4430 [Parafrankia sp. EAN1pec]|nr:hypothetical protein Franean1_4430 [Frankia sp. EAN1pec]